MPIVDSHHHLWDWAVLEKPDFPPGMEILAEDHLPDAFQKELKAAGVDYSVMVGGYPLSFSAHEWYFDTADSCPFIAGVVAWIDMLQPDLAAKQLDELELKPKFVGIRHILDLESDPDWMLQPEVLDSFRKLAQREIPFDMCVNTSHLRNVLTVLQAVPNLRVVVDHIGKPSIAKSVMQGWEEGMRAIADHQQVYCKISGMIEEADWKEWESADLQPYVDKVIDMFGPGRLMFGSDWPVCRLAGEYHDVWEVTQQVLGELHDDDRRAIYGDNAVKFYRLRL